MRAVAADFVVVALLPGCISAQSWIDANQAELFAAAAAETNCVERGLDCDIAEVRRIENVLPVNSLAGQLADGIIDIGLSPTLSLSIPGGRPLVVPLTPRRPNLRITSRGLTYRAD